MPRAATGMLVIAIAAGTAWGQAPSALSAEWAPWYQSLLASRLAACPMTRGATFYFSQAGDDALGDGTAGAPFRSLAKAQAVLAAHPAGDVALLFRRGDIWRETQGLDATAANVTIADYGQGDKPLFTAFESVGEPAGWEPVPGAANSYRRELIGTVTWVKEDDDLDRPYARQGSAAHVEATEGSFWHDQSAGLLYVHPRHNGGPSATDPRTDGKPYECVRPRGSGVIVRGDGSRIQNIRAQGWGMTTGQVTQEHGIESRAEMGSRVAIVGCESHYGMTHVMTHWANQGGVATFVDCSAGLTTFLTDGGSQFNAYAVWGEQDVVWDRCTATHGALPSDDHDTSRRWGTAFFSHTNNTVGSLSGRILSNACTVRATTFGCGIASAFSNLPEAAAPDQARCVLVGERFEGGPGTGAGFGLVQESAVRLNGRYLGLAPTGDPWGGLSPGTGTGWAVNCTLELDCSQVGHDYALFDAPGFAGSRAKLWNCDVRVRTAPGQVCRFTADAPALVLGSEAINCIVAGSGEGTVIPNFPPPPPVSGHHGGPGSALVANAYWNVDPAAIATDWRRVVLTSPPGLGERPACASPLVCGAAPLGAGLTIGVDQSGLAGARRTIGPLEAPPCGNCDGSTTPPALNVQDFSCFLTKFAAGDPSANCDGSTTAPSLNTADFTCFLNAFARGCG